MPDAPIYAIAYARVSAPKQAVQGESLDIQAKQLRAEIERKGWTLFPDDYVFQEPFTGETDDRPVYQAILSLIKKNPGKVKYFLVKQIDRFSREGSMRYQQMKTVLAAYGVELRDVGGVIQAPVNSLADFGFRYKWSENSPSRISEIVIAETASLEKSLILTRLIGAEIKLTQDGYHVRRADDGYVAKRIYVGGKKKFALIPDPERAHFFREMFRLRADGVHSDEEIVRQINALGYRTKTWNRWNADGTEIVGRKAGIPLTSKQLQKLILRPIFCGVICEKWTHGKPVRAQGGESLVSIETFNAANRGKVFISEAPDGGLTLLHDHYPERVIARRKAFNPAFPYRNVVICSTCRHPLLASFSRSMTGRRYGAYHCSRSHPREAVSKEVLEPVFTDYLSNLRLTEDFLVALERMMIESFKDAEGSAQEDTQAVERKVKALEERKDQLVEAFAQASSDIMRQDLERKALRLTSEIEQLRATSQVIAVKEADIHTFISYVKFVMERPAFLLEKPDSMKEQMALFGLVFDVLPTFQEIVNGTAVLSLTFALSEQFKQAKSRLVTLQTPGWNSLVEDMLRWRASYWILDIYIRKVEAKECDLDAVA